MKVSLMFDSDAKGSSDKIRVKSFAPQAVTYCQKNQSQILPERSCLEVSQIQMELGRQHAGAIERLRIRRRRQNLFFVTIEKARYVRNSGTDVQHSTPHGSVDLHVLR